MRIPTLHFIFGRINKHTDVHFSLLVFNISKQILLISRVYFRLGFRIPYLHQEIDKENYLLYSLLLTQNVDWT